MATYSERIELREEILPNQTIQLRTATIIERDGVEVGRSYHRQAFVPGSDVSSAPAEVRAIANVLWTPEVVSAYVEATSIDEV